MNKIVFSYTRINLAIVILSTILMLVVLNSPIKPNRFGDLTFHEESKNLALYIKGIRTFDNVMITKAPGPILFYTPAYLLAPANASDDQLWVYGMIFSSIFMMISLMLILRISTVFFSKEVGLLSVFLFFIFPIHCYYSLGILAEVPAFFSLTLAIYGWSLAFMDPNKKRGWMVLILGMWLLILNRPNTLLLLALLFLVIAYSFFRNKVFFVKYGKKMIYTFLSVSLLVFGTLQIAKKITGNKSDVNQESYFYYVAHQGRFQFREEPTDFRFWDGDNRADSKDHQNWLKSGEELNNIIAITKKSYNDVYKEFIIKDIFDHPFWFTRQFVIKSFYGHINIISKVQPEQFDLGPFKGVFGYWFFLLILNSINLIVLVGVVLFLFHEKNLIQYWIFWGITISLLIFHGLTYMEPRYIYPSKASLYIMSSAGLYRVSWIRIIINRISIYMFPVSKN
jgi:hypothetical protein